MKKKERYRSKVLRHEDDEVRIMLNFERWFWPLFNEFLFNNGKGSYTAFERLWRTRCNKYQKEFRYVKVDPAWFFVYAVCHWTYN